MSRLTILVDDRDHHAMKLLAIRDSKRIAAVVDEAIKLYLKKSGAYDLSITSSDINTSNPRDDDGQK